MEIDKRYERHAPFIKEQDRLYKANILLAGCGAGSSLAPRLARMGVGIKGGIILADPDTVDRSNLNRQEYNENDVGKNKALCLQERIKSINSNVHTIVETDGVTVENLERLVSASDIIVDMIDISVPEIMFGLHAEAMKQHRPVITGLDVGEGVISYIFDYRDPKAMSLNRFVGLSDQTTIDDIKKLPYFPLAMQFIIGPVKQEFENIEEAEAYYSGFFDLQLDELEDVLPEEARDVLPRLLEGQLDFVPQTDTAATLLGVTHEKLIREILLGKPVPTVPNAIRFNLNELLQKK